jgi:hypothetical protein
MSVWRSAGASFALLGLSGCFVDAGKSTGGGDPGSAADGATSTAEQTTAEPTTAGGTETTGGTTQVDGSSDDDDDDDATGDRCGVAGEACEDDECCGCLVCLAGTCLPNNGACGGECRSCDAEGICNLADVGASCEARTDEDCTAMVWGVEEGACYAFDVATGTCDAMGQCVGAACVEQGEEIVSCPECMLAENACTPGANAASVEVASFCATNGTTPGCAGSECDGDSVVYLSCGETGVCQESAESCGDYTCVGGACATDCASDSDCSGSLECFLGACG